MGRHQKPEAMRILHNTDKKNPARSAGASPPPQLPPLGPPPEHLTHAQAKIWGELHGQMHASVPTASDRIAFEMMVSLVDEFRKFSGAIPTARMAQLTSLLARFGMTPADRTKINFGAPEEKRNPFSQV